MSTTAELIGQAREAAVVARAQAATDGPTMRGELSGLLAEVISLKVELTAAAWWMPSWWRRAYLRKQIERLGAI